VCYSLWDLRGSVPSNSTRFYRSLNYNQELVELVAASRSTRKSDLNLWVESQSHKQGCACVVVNPRRERVHGFGALARGRVSKLLYEVALDLGLNLL